MPSAQAGRVVVLHLLTDATCDRCAGTNVRVTTTSRQGCDDCDADSTPGSWWADEDDVVDCGDCGEVGVIRTDGDKACVSWPGGY